MKKTILLLFGIYICSIYSCQENLNNTTESISDIQQIKSSVDFNELSSMFGKPDFTNILMKENKEHNLKTIAIPFMNKDYEQAVFLGMFKEGKFLANRSFITKVESFDDKVNFDSNNFGDQPFKGRYSSYNMKSKKVTFSHDFNYKINEGAKNPTLDGIDCLRTTPYPGYDVCNTDNVGNCVGYKLCEQGIFASIACFAGPIAFAACILAHTADCQVELCWDNDSSNNYIY